MRIIITLTLCLGTLFGFGQMNNIEFVEYDLDNGLHVILHQDASTPIVAVSVMYHVGSKNENPNRTGFAHFFEVLEQREAALPEALSYFSTHPLSKDRRERIERVARQQIGTKRIITQEEWQALKSVCK